MQSCLNCSDLCKAKINKICAGLGMSKTRYKAFIDTFKGTKLTKEQEELRKKAYLEIEKFNRLKKC